MWEVLTGWNEVILKHPPTTNVDMGKAHGLPLEKQVDRYMDPTDRQQVPLCLTTSPVDKPTCPHWRDTDRTGAEAARYRRVLRTCQSTCARPSP